ncbi:hypothetical protein [Thauera humireducens]|uniref:hypothetical protein n=1 Tax=Thauera humireducens TaxID=1134435 RepID=UPI00311E6171
MWLPDLSRLDWRMFTLYDMQPAPTPILLAASMGLAYVIALLSLAVVVFRRRDFI